MWVGIDIYPLKVWKARCGGKEGLEAGGDLLQRPGTTALDAAVVGIGVASVGADIYPRKVWKARYGGKEGMEARGCWLQRPGSAGLDAAAVGVVWQYSLFLGPTTPVCRY